MAGTSLERAIAAARAANVRIALGLAVALAALGLTAPAQAAALGLPEDDPGTLVREGDRVVVEAHFEAGAIAALAAVKADGAKVLTASRRYQTLSLAIAPADLPALAAVPGVAAVTPVPAPRHAAEGPVASPTLCEGGSVISEALQQMNVAAARDAFGARGAGRTIGIISDSFDSATEADTGGPIKTKAPEDVRTGDLPGPTLGCAGQQTPVDVLVESPADAEPRPNDEGRAMLQVVHDLAPHAKLAFASDFGGELDFAHDIELLAAPVSAGGAGADVIIDDLGLPTEPFFQEGPAEEAIRRVREKGVLYFTSAGNENRFNAEGEEISSWEAPRFRDAGVADDPEACGAAAVADITEGIEAEGRPGPYEPDCMDFDPGPAVDTQFGITVQPGAHLTINLQWAEPWFGVETDLVALLVAGPEGGPGEEVLATGGSLDLPAQPQDGVFWTNETGAAVEARLVLARCAGPNCAPGGSASADPRLKFTIEAGANGVSEIEYPAGKAAGTEDTVGPTIVGHPSSPYAVTVASVPYWEPADAPVAPEPHSSRGPAAFYFGPVEGTVPAAPLATPEILAKPDITATDCASTTFFAQLFGDGVYHFCGTSEAAPQAGAVAALMEQAAPLATPTQVIEAMESSATPFTVVSRPAAVGAGLVDALRAMEAVGAQPVDDPPSAALVPPAPEEEKAPSPAPPPPATPAPGAPPQATPAKEGTPAPRARFLARPRKVVKTRKRSVVLGFRLGAGGEGVSFLCQFDGGAARACPATFHHRFGKGSHTVRVRAEDAAGNVSAKPTVFHFRVEQLPRRR
jgi:hypothetical protein